jgi:hypothetical protein
MVHAVYMVGGSRGGQTEREGQLSIHANVPSQPPKRRVDNHGAILAARQISGTQDACMHAQHRARWPIRAYPELLSSLAATTQLCPSAPLAVAPMWGCRRMLSARLLHFRCLAPLPAQPLAGHTIHRNCSLPAPIALLQPRPQAPKPSAHYPLSTACCPRTREYERQRSPRALVPPCPLAALSA